MEDLFNFIANDYSDSIDGSLTQDVMDNSVARANDFFGLGNYDGLGMDAHSPLSFEGIDSLVAESYHYEDQFFNPTTFVEMGFSGQDALDLLITHEGTGVMLHDMDVHFDGFQEELCSDYMTGVRAGLAGIDVSQIEYALADIPQELGHANGDFRAEAFLEGVNFANEYMETHDQYPTFSECFEEYNNEHMQDLADLARLEDQLFAQECEMAHYQHLAEEQPDNELLQQQFQESEARYHEVHSEYEQRLNMIEDDNVGEGHHVSFKGMFINDRSWNIDRAKKNYEQAETEMKDASRAKERGDDKAVKEHLESARQRVKDAKDYEKAARKSTKD